MIVHQFRLPFHHNARVIQRTPMQLEMLGIQAPLTVIKLSLALQVHGFVFQAPLVQPCQLLLRLVIRVVHLQPVGIMVHIHLQLAVLFLVQYVTACPAIHAAGQIRFKLHTAVRFMCSCLSTQLSVIFDIVLCSDLFRAKKHLYHNGLCNNYTNIENERS